MKQKILLINNDQAENVIIEDTLKAIIGDHFLSKAENGKSAFNILMGNSSEKPTVILLNYDLLDMSSIDFLKVMQNYYSLNHIRIFLLTEPLTDQQLAVFNKLGITDYIYRPVLNNTVAFEAIASKHNFLPVFMGITSLHALKAKCAFWINGFKNTIIGQKISSIAIYSASVKAAVLATAILIATGATHTIKKKQIEKVSINKYTDTKPIELISSTEEQNVIFPNAKPVQKNISLNKMKQNAPVQNRSATLSDHSDTSLTLRSNRALRIKVIEEADSSHREF
ncbi:MAG: response regulator [Bacteroidota bacterium]